MPQPLLVANWKMNKSVEEAVTFIQSTSAELHRLKKVKAVICPTYMCLPVVSGLLRGTEIELGAQDVAAWQNGAYTGEISASMLAEFCSYVIVGHSERRRLCQETDELIIQKIHMSWAAGLHPIVCVSSEEEVLALAGIEGRQAMTMAYEPLSAIGSGKPADPASVTAFVAFIRGHLGKSMPVLYGGSVDARNIADYLRLCDGALIGSASLNPTSFIELCKAAIGH